MIFFCSGRLPARKSIESHQPTDTPEIIRKHSACTVHRVLSRQMSCAKIRAGSVPRIVEGNKPAALALRTPRSTTFLGRLSHLQTNLFSVVRGLCAPKMSESASSSMLSVERGASRAPLVSVHNVSYDFRRPTRSDKVTR
jgi:hypothetical protein